MPTGRLEWSLFVAAVMVLAVLAGGIAIEAQGDGADKTRAIVVAGTVASPVVDPVAPAGPSATSRAPTPAAKRAKAPAEAKPKKTQRVAPAPPSAAAERPAKPQLPVFTLTATRGDSWLSVHVGSSSGKLLYEGLLAKGHTLRYRAPLLWVRFGAATNVDVRTGTHRVRLPFGTADVLIRRSGRAELVGLG